MSINHIRLKANSNVSRVASLNIYFLSTAVCFALAFAVAIIL
jgi:hypothetical protein